MAESKPTPVTTPEEVSAFAEAQQAEYGTWFAVSAISHNGSPAYNIGDPVPVSNVAKYKYDEQGLVAKVGSKAGQDIIAALATPADVNAEVPAPVSLNVPVK